MFSPDADLFFLSPRTKVDRPNWFGVLYLLRRDIDLCMGINPDTGEAMALWPGAMAMLAGIDLLAKFFAGCDDGGPGKVGNRFRMFLERFFVGTSSTHRGVIYQLRNSLLHSFGLYSPNYRFFLTNHGAGALVSYNPPDRYHVDLRVLHREFEKAVAAYCAALDSDPQHRQLQANFKAMLGNYGRIHID